MDRLQAPFSKLRRRSAWTRRVRAFVATREITIGKNDAWHVHLHLVIDADYWPQGDLAEEWICVTNGESSIVDIRKADPGIERELLKYTFKLAGVPSERLVEFALAVKGKRMVSTGGAWYGRVSDEDLDDSEPEEYETISFFELLSRVARGDSWAVAVKDVVEHWIGGRWKHVPLEKARHIAMVH